jgi:hypothetical protein
MIVATASFHAQVKQWIYPEKTISKNISLNVSAGSEYSSRAYANSVAMLQYTVIKVKGNKSVVLLENVYPELELKKLHLLSPAFLQNIHISGVNDNKEQIIINYTITYKSNGSVLKIQNSRYISKGENNQLNITI